jgi:polyisoprenoid-binding protein YceI
MKFFFLFLSIFLMPLSFAKCIYEFDPKSPTVSWRAFKTPKKVGVDGRFSSVTIHTNAGPTIEDVVRRASFSVDVKSLTTGNPGRDDKILRSFFRSKEKILTISGKVTEVTASGTKVIFTIGGKESIVLMNTEVLDGKIKLTGKVDVLSFGLSENLKAITDACRVLHEGVTWPDVEIGLTANFKRRCSAGKIE